MTVVAVVAVAVDGVGVGGNNGNVVDVEEDGKDEGVDEVWAMLSIVEGWRLSRLVVHYYSEWYHHSHYCDDYTEIVSWHSTDDPHREDHPDESHC